jgi:hypothetical protein
MAELNFQLLFLRTVLEGSDLSSGNHAKVAAACISLAAFAIAIIAGIAVDNPLDVTLSRALGAMAGCFVIGYGIGVAGEHVFLTRLEELRHAQRPRGDGAPGAHGSHSAAGTSTLA